MTATGIGAPVRRKEDQRFITGKGHYTDDHARPDQVFAHFIRSPHAHAKLKKIDTSAAAVIVVTAVSEAWAVLWSSSTTCTTTSSTNVAASSLDTRRRKVHE